MLRIHEIKLQLTDSLDTVPAQIEKRLGLKGLDLQRWQVVKESLDARDKGDILRVYSVDFQIAAADQAALTKREEELIERGKARKLKLDWAPDTSYKPVVTAVDGKRQLTAHGLKRLAQLNPEQPNQTRPKLLHRPVVVGFGPCGMFAALLLAEMGYRPLVLERGKTIAERAADVERFWREGVLDPQSNVQFGEGGAGSFSDGKLTTQIKDERIRKVLEELVNAGGGEELLYRQKPHVGTDVLRAVVIRIREKIQQLGGEVRFQCQLSSIEWQENANGRQVSAVAVTGPDGQEEVIPAEAVILALGHSARDTVEMLFEKDLVLEQKPFSLGVRIEHPQEMVNEAQYGKKWREYELGAADYKLSHRCADGRGVYTFCMCPGGLVIGAASEAGGVVTNGMSYRNRGEKNANSGLLVDVRTTDFGSDHPLAGLEFQRKYERLAFQAGGGSYQAPAQRLGSFINGSTAKVAAGNGAASTDPSYRPGVTWTNLADCLPEFVVTALKEALPHLGRKLRGFDRPDAVLTAVESRSSSPVRMKRDAGFEANIKGIYPGGEGAGYAGGITSAAVDGIRIAEAIALRYQ